MTYSATVVTVNSSGSVSNNGTKQMYKTGIGTTTAYTVTVTLTDSVGNSVSRSVFVPTIEIPFVIDPSLPGVGVGAIPQNARTLELASNWWLKPGGGLLGLPNANAYTPTYQGRHVVVLPCFRGTYMGTTGTYQFILKWLQVVCASYPNRLGCYFFGPASSDTNGYISATIYDTSTVDANGYPEYCVGEYIQPGTNGVWKWSFRTWNYTPYVNCDTLFKTQKDVTLSVTAGTIGTRGGQKVWSSSDIGGTPRYVFIADFSSSNNCQREIILSGTNVYLNVYRATTSAFNEHVYVDIYYTPNYTT